MWITLAGIGALCGGVVAIYTWRDGQLQRYCPECTTPLPRSGGSQTKRQGGRAGWICANCGCESDRRGRLVNR
jgi:hypothetical protein